MGELVGICGESGSGKTMSASTLDPSSTFIMQVINKQLPFKGWKKNYRTREEDSESFNRHISSDPESIMKAMDHISQKRPEIKNLVIDDFQYIMAQEFMNRASETGFQKFTDIADHIWQILRKAAEDTRDDLKIIILTHDEAGEGGKKMKTIGKLLDEKLSVQGLFTIFLFSRVRKDYATGKVHHEFVTNHDGTYPAKSPPGMFEEECIPNDLGYVVKCIDEFSQGE